MTTKAPDNLPGYEWTPMAADSKVPENATYYPFESYLEGLEVRIGRVYDQNCLYVGTAIPEKGICTYITKDLEVKSSPNYEIVVFEYWSRVNFRDVKLENSNLKTIFELEVPIFFDWEFPADMNFWNIIVPAGLNEKGEALGVVKYSEGDNTYYGWVDPATKKAYIPREAQRGPQVLDQDFSVMLRGGMPRSMLMKCPIMPNDMM